MINDAKYDAKKYAAVMAEMERGFVNVVLIAPLDVLEIIDHAMNGHPRATAAFHAVSFTIEEVDRANAAGAPKQCFLCQHPVPIPFGFGIMMPDMDVPTCSMAFVLCYSCAEDQAFEEEIKPRVLAAMREMWPASKVIDVNQHAPGHA